jgi:hypothetical protein
VQGPMESPYESRSYMEERRRGENRVSQFLPLGVRISGHYKGEMICNTLNFEFRGNLKLLDKIHQNQNESVALHATAFSCIYSIMR